LLAHRSNALNIPIGADAEQWRNQPDSAIKTLVLLLHNVGKDQLMELLKTHYDWLVAPVPTWMFIGFVFVWALHALRIDVALDQLVRLMRPTSQPMNAEMRPAPARRWPWRRAG